MQHYHHESGQHGQQRSSSGSGAAVFYKEAQCGALRASLLTFCAFVLLILSLILHIVAIAITEWAITEKYYNGESGILRTKKIGLWYKCLGSTCTGIDDDGTLRTVRAFTILGLLFMLAAVIFTCLFISPLTSVFVRYIMIATRAITWLCVMIAFSVFTQRGPMYGPAFCLEIVVFIFETLSVAMLIVDFVLYRDVRE